MIAFVCFRDRRLAHTQDRWAAPVASDDANVKLFRPALAQTNFEFRPLKLQFDASADGWSADAFHAAVDRQGPAVVFCRSKTGGVFGGYNPKGCARSPSLTRYLYLSIVEARLDAYFLAFLFS